MLDVERIRDSTIRPQDGILDPEVVPATRSCKSMASALDPRNADIFRRGNDMTARWRTLEGSLRQNRRDFLIASTAGLIALPGAAALRASSVAATPNSSRTAKSTILFFLSGGASHIDTWDMKPNAPVEYRGEFQPISTSSPGISLCEHLPLLAKQAHHLAIVNSIGATVNTNDHHAGYYYNLTGHVPDQSFLTLGNNRTPMPDDWPYMGSVVASKLPLAANLPNAVTLPHKPSKLPYTRPGQFAGRLGVEHNPLYVIGTQERPLDFQVPALALQCDVNAERVLGRKTLLESIDDLRRGAESFATPSTWSTHQERAFSLLSSTQTMQAFDVKSEPLAVRERYGQSVNAMSLLAARRLVEVGVPFVTVHWLENEKIDGLCKSAGGWDTHGNNFQCLKDHLLPEFDRAFSALLEDLSLRGMLDETLVLVTSEMGRTPKIGDPRSGGKSGAGRDHWTHCLSDLLAGGGIQGGQTYGKSDPRAEYPADKPVTPAHIAKTVYHAMGVHDLSARDSLGRPYELLAEGAPLLELF